MKFILAGTIDTNAKVGLFSSSMSSLKDQNTVILRAFNKKTAELAEELYNLIMNNISKAKSSKSSNTVMQSSNLDELKKLAESKEVAVVTEKEFEEQKAKLLNN